MSPFPPDNVVLVAGRDEKRVQLAVHLRAHIKRLSLEGNRPIQHKLLRSEQRRQVTYK